MTITGVADSGVSFSLPLFAAWLTRLYVTGKSQLADDRTVSVYCADAVQQCKECPFEALECLRMYAMLPVPLFSLAYVSLNFLSLERIVVCVCALARACEPECVCVCVCVCVGGEGGREL